MDEKQRAPHSAQYIDTGERDFWWHADFIALLARRCRLAEATTVLDVGCGAGPGVSSSACQSDLTYSR
ncbi:MAG TPA: hypothetical protein VF403_10525 [Kofleriaceae bacterium]